MTRAFQHHAFFKRKGEGEGCFSTHDCMLVLVPLSTSLYYPSYLSTCIYVYTRNCRCIGVELSL